MARCCETVAPWLLAQVSSCAASARHGCRSVLLLQCALLCCLAFFVSPAPVALIAATLSEMQCLQIRTAACLHQIAQCSHSAGCLVSYRPLARHHMVRDSSASEESITALTSADRSFKCARARVACSPARCDHLPERLPIGACRAACAKPPPLLPVAAFCYALPRPSHG